MEDLTHKAQLIAKIMVALGVKFQIGGSFGLYKRKLITRQPRDLDIFTYPGKYPEICTALGLDKTEPISSSYDDEDGAYKASYMVMGVKVCFFLTDIYGREMDTIDGLPISKPTYAIAAKKGYVIKLVKNMALRAGTARKHFDDLEQIAHNQKPL